MSQECVALPWRDTELLRKVLRRTPSAWDECEQFVDLPGPQVPIDDYPQRTAFAFLGSHRPEDAWSHGFPVWLHSLTSLSSGPDDPVIDRREDAMRPLYDSECG